MLSHTEFDSIPPCSRQNIIRELTLNKNHWFPISFISDLKPNRINAIQLWNQTYGVFKSDAGHWKVIENNCICDYGFLNQGKIKDKTIQCANHEWTFDEDGNVLKIHQTKANNCCPNANFKSLNVQERYGLLWVFGGNQTLAKQTDILHIPEFAKKGWQTSFFDYETAAHFSLCLRNDMNLQDEHFLLELFKSHDAFLDNMERSEDMLLAQYIAKTQDPKAPLSRLSIEYHYPHVQYTHSNGSLIYLLHLPLSAKHTKTFMLILHRKKQAQTIIEPIKSFLSGNSLSHKLKSAIHKHKCQAEQDQKVFEMDSFLERKEENPVIKALRRELENQHLRAIT